MFPSLLQLSPWVPTQRGRWAKIKLWLNLLIKWNQPIKLEFLTLVWEISSQCWNGWKKILGHSGKTKTKCMASSCWLIACPKHNFNLIQVTAFGESAGSIMTSILYLNSPLEMLIRGTVNLPQYSAYFIESYQVLPSVWPSLVPLNKSQPGRLSYQAYHLVRKQLWVDILSTCILLQY